jgi:hypothetical protein
LAEVVVVAGALLIKNQPVGHLPPLVALPPYQQRVSRPLLPLVALVVKTMVVVVELAERLGDRLRLERAAQVDH